MASPYYEVFQETRNTGIRIAYLTTPGGYHPLHWHEELEILYILNGQSAITIEGKKYMLPKKHVMVIESRQVHSTYAYDEVSMFICIHISKKHMQQYLPDIEAYKILCHPERITDDQFPAYLEICKQIEALTRLYMENPPTLLLESEGLILQIFAHLLQHFSIKTPSPSPGIGSIAMERLREVISYVEEHFREPITLDDITALLGLGKEYFCRFFKKHMGMSFLQYLNEVRISHIYQDLTLSDMSVSEAMERNGFTNQKLFNKTFKQIYGCTPSSVRKKRPE